MSCDAKAERCGEQHHEANAQRSARGHAALLALALQLGGRVLGV
jgi:hypothetical protein